MEKDSDWMMAPAKTMCPISKFKLDFRKLSGMSVLLSQLPLICRIESEDQLDTAKKPGDEKESKDEEDADCKEERGIDMSEDFDSKLQVGLFDGCVL